MTDPRFRRRADALSRRSLEAVLLLPVGVTEPVTLGGTGPEVWDLLAEPRSLAELSTLLATAHGVEKEVVAADVGAVVGRLVEIGALERVP